MELNMRGFGDHWVRWISSLLWCSSCTILLNGVAGALFSCNRGLRQGDPLFPLILNLCVAVLFRMIHLASTSQSLPIMGIGDVKIHTLQFADDLLLFFDYPCRSAVIIKLILDAFSEHSGLKVNYRKSAIISINEQSSLCSGSHLWMLHSWIFFFLFGSATFHKKVTQGWLHTFDWKIG